MILFVPITYTNTLKTCFPNKKYLNTIQTHPTKIVIDISLIEKQVFKGCLKIIGEQNELPITYY